MFSLRTIQKEINKLRDTPAAAAAGDEKNGQSKRKRQPGPETHTSKKQRQDAARTRAAALNTDLNSNKMPQPASRPTLTTTEAAGGRNRRSNAKKKKNNTGSQDGSLGVSGGKKERRNQLNAPPSLPVLCADAGDGSSRHWEDLRGDSDSGEFTSSPAEGAEGGSKAVEKEERRRSSASDSNRFTDDGNDRFKYLQRDARRRTGVSTDSDASESGQNHRHRAQNSNPKEAAEVSSDSDRSRRGGREKRTQGKNAKKRNDHEEKTDFDVDRSLIGECLAVATTKRGTVLAALPQGATLYLQGTIRVSPVLGSVEILGYRLQQGKGQLVYSLPSSSLLGVTAIEAQALDGVSDSMLGVEAAWLEELKGQTSSAVLLEVTRQFSPRVSFLLSAGWEVLGRCREVQTPWHSVGASVVTRENCPRNRVTRVLPEWSKVAQMLVETLKCGSVPCVVVCGGKGVGKSTFFKYLSNTLLSATPETGVMCLDFDPGQPELSLPTSLSLTRITQPLLGPAYAHNLSEVALSRTQRLVGATNPQFALENYVSAVRDLCRVVRGHSSGAPVLVNTMGWTRGTGIGLMLDVLRLADPTHVVQIQSKKATLNYPYPLGAVTVGAARGGITTQADTTDLHYSLTLLPSGGQPSSAPHMSQPQALREMRVLAEAGQAVEGCRITVPWARVALHVCEEQVPRDRILQVLNAQLVALCSVDPASLCRPHPDLPQLLTPSSGFGDLLGWAVVMGIDPLTCVIHLATSLPEAVVNEQVNALVKPRIHLPASFYKLFCTGVGPYLERENREGAGKLRVGRNLKPRGPLK